MSDMRRILDPGSGESALARDLVGSGRSDAPPAGAKERARARLEKSVGTDGVTTHISALSEAMAAGLLAPPVLASVPVAIHGAPTPVASRRGSRAQVVLVGAAGAGILALGVLAIVAVLRAPRAAPTVAAAPTAASNAAPALATAAPTPAPTANAAAAGAPPGTAEPTAAATSGTNSTTTHPPVVASAGGTSSHATSGGHGQSGSHASGGATVASSGGGGTCSQRCHGDINCLLQCGTQTGGGGGAGGGSAGGGAGGGGGGGGGSGGGARGAADQPSRNDVIAAMGSVRSDVNHCARGTHGTAWVSVTFAGNGHVSTANVDAPYAGTPAGSCISRAVRRATVPRFTRPTFSVRYPFSIR